MLFFLQWFKPKICFRKFYVMEKFENPTCDCLFTCKYPPPNKLERIVVTQNNRDIRFKYLSKVVVFEDR